MMISLRNWHGQEIDRIPATDGKDAVHEAMMLLVRRDHLDVGDLLSVDDDNVPDPAQARVTLTAGNIKSLSERLDQRAGFLEKEQPEAAADLRMASRLLRHIIRVGWVISSVAV